MKKIAAFAAALACLAGLAGFLLYYCTDNSRRLPASPSTAAKHGHYQHNSGQAAGKTGQTADKSIAPSQPAAVKAGLPEPHFQRVGSEVVASDGKTYPLRTYHILSLPNDPSANQPWVSLSDMSAAWDVPHGNHPTLLAMIDTGFDLQHEEFQGRWYTNSNDPANGADDDHNGLVDDTRGWDFANNDNDVQAQAQGRHGTFTSGIAAATGNNGKGIAGVDWGTAILPVQALGEDGTGYNSDVANGIVYAADQGADVISLSLGSSQSDSVVRQAVDYAISKGSVVVAAAGNNGCNCMSYPANYPEVVAVGALDTNGQPASFSSYGANLDIMAPGVNLYTTDWQPGNPTSAYAGGISGTSLSTPIVSGLLTRLKSLQPNATPIQLIAALMETTNRSSLAASDSRSDQLGFGLLDGGQASQRLSTPYSPASLTSYTPLSFGQSLSPGSPAEKSIGNAIAYRCGSRPGGTPIYSLTKTNQEFFSTSPAEAYQATTQGYASSMFGYACVTEPQDAPGQNLPAPSLHKAWNL